jgi:hypothetical protein
MAPVMAAAGVGCDLAAVDAEQCPEAVMLVNPAAACWRLGSQAASSDCARTKLEVLRTSPTRPAAAIPIKTSRRRKREPFIGSPPH